MNFEQLLQTTPTEAGIEQNTAEERGTIINVLHGEDRDMVTNDLVANGNKSEYHQRQVAIENENINNAFNKAKRDVLVDPEVPVEIKEQVLTQDKAPIELVDYEQTLIEDMQKRVEDLDDHEWQVHSDGLDANNVFDQFIINNQKEAVKKQLVDNINYLIAKDAKLKSDLNIEQDLGVAETGAELLQMSFTGAQHQMYIGLADHLGIEINPDEAVLHGRLLKKIKDKWQNLDTIQAKTDFLDKTKDWLWNNSGYGLGNNSNESLIYMDMILDDALSGEESGFTEGLESVFGALDSFIIASILKTPLKGLMSAGKQIANGINSSIFKATAGSAPKKMKEIAELLNTGKATPKQLGTSFEEINHAVVESGDMLMTNTFRDTYLKTGEKALSIAKEVADDIAHNSHTYRPVSITTLEDTANKVTGRLRPTLLRSNTKVEVVNENAQVTTRYGESGESGFNSYDHAVHEASLYGMDYGILLKRPNGEFVDVTKEAEKYKGIEGIQDLQGEFFIEVKEQFSLQDMMLDTTFKLKKDDVRFPWLGSRLHAYALDSTSGVAERYSKGIDSVLDMAEGSAYKIKEILEDFDGLKKQEKYNVLAEVNKSVENKQPLTIDYIHNSNLTEVEKQGLWAYHLTNDAVHHIAGSQLARRYVREGNHVINIGEDFSTIGRILSEDQAKGLQVLESSKSINGTNFPAGSFVYYDHLDDTVKFITKERIEEIYENGGHIAKSVEDLGGNQVVSKYIIVPTEAKIGDIPPNPLNYRSSYGSARIDTSKVFVRQKKSIIREGKLEPYYRAVGGGNDILQAKKIKKELLEQNPEGNYVIDWANELSPKEASRIQDDLRLSRGQLITSKRSEERMTAGGEKHTIIENPIDALNESIHRVTDKGVRGSYIKQLEKEWSSTFSGLTKDGKYPTERGQIQARNIEKGIDVSKARIFYDRIELVRNLHESWLADGQRAVFLKFAELLAGKTSTSRVRNFLSKGSIKIAETPVDTLVKSIAFHLYIAANPLRQIVLQGQQVGFAASIAPAYAATKMIPDMAGLNWGMAVLSNKSLSKKLANNEYVKLARQFKESGMPGTIEQTGLAAETGLRRQASQMGKSGEALENVTKLAKLPFTAGMFGFKTGEGSINVVGSWLVARQRFKKKHGFLPKNRKDYQTVNADARQIALSMSAQSGFAYSRNLGGMFTQFLSVQHKMGLAMTVNPIFNKAERLQILGAQFAYYGAQGFGAAHVMERLSLSNDWDLSDKAQTFLEGGLVDLAALEFLGRGYDVSKSFAPAGGFGESSFRLLEAISGATGQPFFAAIPAYQAVNKIYQFATTIGPMIVGKGMHDQTPFESGEQLFDAYMSIGSGWSNWTISQASAKVGEYVTSKGVSTGIRFDSYADYAMNLLGLKAKGVQDMYELKELTGFVKPYNQEALSEDAKRYAKGHIEIFTKYMKGMDSVTDPDSHYLEMTKELNYLRSYIKSVNPDYAGIIVEEGIQKIINSERSNTLYDAAGQAMDFIAEGRAQDVFFGTLDSERFLLNRLEKVSHEMEASEGADIRSAIKIHTSTPKEGE